MSVRLSISSRMPLVCLSQTTFQSQARQSNFNPAELVHIRKSPNRPGSLFFSRKGTEDAWLTPFAEPRLVAAVCLG